MSRPSNAQISNDIQRALSKSRKDLEKLVAETSGANSEPVKQASFTLARAWRKLLSVPRAQLGPDLANAPPRQRTAKLRKSIRSAVIDGMRRVGTDSFVARLFEFGYAGKRTFARALGRDSRGRSRTVRTQVAQAVSQPPRPHASVALEQVKDRMTEVMVSETQRRVTQGGR